MKYFIVISLSLLTALLFAGNKPKPKDDVLLLRSNNTLSLNMPVMPESVRSLEEKAFQLDQKLPKGEPLYLVLNSPGGSVEAGINLIEFLKGLGRPIHTISMFSASMSFVISQYLNTRYVISSGTLMTHRATVGGIEGTLPGSYQSRSNLILEQILNISQTIATRSGMELEAYLDASVNELWLTSYQAVTRGFADKIVSVKCDKSLSGNTSQNINFLGMNFKLIFSDCPLITTPLVEAGDAAMVDLLFNNKPGFIRQYSQLLQ